MSASPGMWEALRKVEERFAELTDLLGQSGIVSDPKKLRDLSRERARLQETIRTLDEHRSVQRTLLDDEQAVASGDEELAELARAELPELRTRLEQL
jgi:peptide chain release factor 1